MRRHSDRERARRTLRRQLGFPDEPSRLAQLGDGWVWSLVIILVIVLLVKFYGG